MPHIDHLPAGGAAAKKRSALKRQAKTPPGVCRCGDTLDDLSARLTRLEAIHKPELQAWMVSQRRPVSPDKMKAIVELVSEHTGVSVADIMGERRPEHIASARMLAYCLQRKATGAAYKTIGEWWGHDHGTILNGCRRVKDRMQVMPDYAEFVGKLMRKI